jgi:hypothetical protein
VAIEVLAEWRVLRPASKHGYRGASAKGVVTSGAARRALRHALRSLAAPGGTTASPGRCASRTARSSRHSPHCCSHRT